MHSDFWLERDLVSWTEMDFDPVILHEDLRDLEGQRHYLLELREYLRSPAPGRCRGFKETLLFEKLGWLSRFLPELRLVLVVRDPRAVVASVVGRNMASLWSYDRHVAPRVPISEFRGSRSRDDVVAQAAWSWKERLNIALANAVLFDLLIVRLEDFVTSPDTAVPQLMAFLGYDAEPLQHRFCHESHHDTRGGTYSTYRASSDVTERWKKVLNRDDLVHIETTLREEMVRFGYIPGAATRIVPERGSGHGGRITVEPPLSGTSELPVHAVG